MDGGDEVAKLINCECGYVARASSDDAVVDLIRAHMETDHPELLAQVAEADLRGWIQEE
jgi:predicted small metal-binding protein